jgi:anti-sigma regulatory factor (Ser/Thr protein kinase)
MESNTLLSRSINEDAWKILSEFSIPSQQHNEHKAVNGVLQAIEGLPISEQRITQLKTAVAEATMNAMEHGNQLNPVLNADIRVEANSKTLHISIADQGAGGVIPDIEKPDLQEKLKERQSPRGWGFFLIENMVDRMDLRQEGGHNIIDLYLNLE